MSFDFSADRLPVEERLDFPFTFRLNLLSSKWTHVCLDAASAKSNEADSNEEKDTLLFLKNKNIVLFRIVVKIKS